MTAVASSPPASNPSAAAPDPSVGQLKVSAYERVASVLVSLIILIGFFVAIMAMIWLARRAAASHQTVAVEILEEPAGRGDHALGVARDMEEPGVEEILDQTEPALADTLAALTDAVTSQQAALDALEGDADAVGKGSGQGDSRAAGAGGEGSDVIPRWERWQLRFSAGTVDSYAKQLDFFGVELGAIGGGRKEVDYAKKLSGGTATRSASGADEERLHFSWRSGSLKEFDRQLLARAGVDTVGRILVQFVPPDLENQLALLERDFSGGRPVKEIRRTVFGVQSAGDGYAFFVISQDLR